MKNFNFKAFEHGTILIFIGSKLNNFTNGMIETEYEKLVRN